MAYNLKGRSFLTLKDFKKEEIEYLLTLSADLKAKKRAGIKGEGLKGKNIALIFEKPSTRTRCAFAVAAKDEGGMPEYLGKNDIQLGKKESVADTARVLGRMFDGIEFRGYEHQTVEILAEKAGVPVWNGLTDLYHPTQILADFLTLKENFGKLRGLNLVYIGDGRNNMANSLMVGSAIMGVNYTIISPKELRPDKNLLAECAKLRQKSGAQIALTSEIAEGIKGADAVYTDVWTSMGEEDELEARIELLKPYQVNMELIEKSQNSELIFLHCLPAYHNLETENAKKIYQKYGLEELEVTDQVFESKFSKVFDQAENRMHTIKAVMTATI